MRPIAHRDHYNESGNNSFFKGVLKITLAIVLAAIILFILNIGFALGMLKAIAETFSTKTATAPPITSVPPITRLATRQPAQTSPPSNQTAATRQLERAADEIVDKTAKTVGGAIGKTANAFSKEVLRNTVFGRAQANLEPLEPLHQPVKKCIKPNNVIDQEVIDCMKRKN
ncbi:hypothetical protein [Methylogaea oryzae]|uniref:hypothetical protein n=1 Tax=Methylogaea oryzae TaxID=1295382 RepID=UPI0012E149DB|nr:hypothetical protein [Methylogaea oryzae]